MKLKSICALLVLTLLTLPLFAQTLTPAQFSLASGNWKGTLTYLDYQSGKPYEMPANVQIERIGRSSAFKFSHSYPNEASANSIDTVSISNNGKVFDSEEVRSVETLKSGELQILTEILAKDGNDDKPALMRHTYLIGGKTFLIKKEVQFVGTKEWILRHTYSYQR